jgi:Enoyl-CoA hydratase/carnithine racemase
MLQVETLGRVRVLTLDRPAARNAVNPALARALFDAALAFDADPAVDVAILTGAGGYFCAGYDLKSVGAEGAAWIAALDPPDDWDPVAQPIPGPMGPSRLMLSNR